MSDKIFSFCVYGTSNKYCLGIVKNLHQINEKFPYFKVHISVGNDVPEEYINMYNKFNNVTIKKYNYSGNYLKVYRFYPIDLSNSDVVICRDADSRFTNRDIFYINKFLNQNKYNIFTIRDHANHKVPIMAGQWGIKNIQTLNKINIQHFYENNYKQRDIYDNDQLFLTEFIYNKYINSLIVYTHRYITRKENYELMNLPRENEYDFCGNVVLFDSSGNEFYEFKFIS